MYIYILVRYEVFPYCTNNEHCASIAQAGKTAMQAGEGRLQSVFGSHKEILSAILSHLKEFIEV